MPPVPMLRRTSAPGQIGENQRPGVDLAGFGEIQHPGAGFADVEGGVSGPNSAADRRCPAGTAVVAQIAVRAGDQAIRGHIQNPGAGIADIECGNVVPTPVADRRRPAGTAVVAQVAVRAGDKRHPRSRSKHRCRNSRRGRLLLLIHSASPTGTAADRRRPAGTAVVAKVTVRAVDTGPGHVQHPCAGIADVEIAADEPGPASGTRPARRERW